MEPYIESFQDFGLTLVFISITFFLFWDDERLTLFLVPLFMSPLLTLLLVFFFFSTCFCILLFNLDLKLSILLFIHTDNFSFFSLILWSGQLHRNNMWCKIYNSWLKSHATNLLKRFWSRKTTPTKESQNWHFPQNPTFLGCHKEDLCAWLSHYKQQEDQPPPGQCWNVNCPLCILDALSHFW